MQRSREYEKRRYQKILEIREEQDQFKTFVFEKPDNWNNFQPGQFIKFYPVVFLPRRVLHPLILAIASGTNDKQIEVTFSTKASLFNIKTFLEFYGSGHFACVDRPSGIGFPLDNNNAPLLLIGAGTGITALRSIKRSVTPNKPVQIIYSAKTLQDIPYLKEVKGWAENPNNYLALTRADNVAGFHNGRINGHLQNLAIPADTKIFVCGPNGLIQDVVKILLEKSVPMQNIYVSLNKVTPNAGPVYQLSPQVLNELNIPYLTTEPENIFKKKAP